jgi:serine/threonine-protein kinase HipA
VEIALATSALKKKLKMKCLLCYQELLEDQIDYHEKCLVKTFGFKKTPFIEIDPKELAQYAVKIIQKNTAITGVQPKLSLWLTKGIKDIRFTVVDQKSNYIIKPQSQSYTALPENEDLCMHLAKHFGIETATHGLVRLPNGDLAYITKRFDRNLETKFSCEDLCQLTETLTEHKYRGSYERTGKTIQKWSTQSGLDTINYFKLVVFCYVIGNADMHLKNFSMLEGLDGQFAISPCYDLVSTILVIKNENEQMALTVNGRKNKINKQDFEALGTQLSLTEKQIENVFQSFVKNLDASIWWMENSFLPKELKNKIIKTVTKRIHQFA